MTEKVRALASYDGVRTERQRLDSSSTVPANRPTVYPSVYTETEGLWGCVGLSRTELLVPAARGTREGGTLSEPVRTASQIGLWDEPTCVRS